MLRPALLGDAYLGDRCSEDHHLVQLANPFHESVNTRSLDNIDIMILPLYFYRDCEVGLMENLNIVSHVTLYRRSWITYLETAVH